jgi:hypothetical protein
MANAVDLLVAVLAEVPDGLTRPELLRRLREQIPYLQPEDVERAIRAAGDQIRSENDRLYASVSATEPPPPRRLPSHRFVVFDLESIVRPITREPYREQHVFQVGALRFGPDEQWVAERQEYRAFAALPSSNDELLIYNDELRGRYLEAKRPLAEVLEEFQWTQVALGNGLQRIHADRFRPKRPQC